MAIVLIDGFDVYNGVQSNIGLQANWNCLNSTLLSMQPGRFGGQAVKVAFESGSSNDAPSMYKVFTGATSCTVGFALYTDVLNAEYVAAAGSNVVLRSGLTDYVNIFFNAVGGITVKRATTELGSSVPGLFTSDNWYFIEIETVISDTVGRVTVYVNGASVLNLTNQDTKNGTATTVDNVEFMSGAEYLSQGGTYWYDDLYVTDTGTKLGESRVETLYPNADTAVKQWTPLTGTENYAMVDEAQCDGDTTYVYASSTATDNYDFGNLSDNPSAVRAVQAVTFAKKTDTATRNLYLQTVSGATTSDGPAIPLLSTYTRFNRIMETDPNTAAAWTYPDVNTVKGGPKIL
jgi:hypothetical protein